MRFDKLLNGGYIIYFRHTEATVGNDNQTVKFEDCRTQRNLSKTGKQQAMIIGKVFRLLGIPMEPFVISSPFCRAIDTSNLAFPRKIICIVPSLAEIVSLCEMPTITDAKRTIIIHEIRRLFELPPSKGQNRLIIGHSFPKEIEFGNLPYMTGIVIHPKGWRNGYEVIGKLDFNKIN